MGTSLVEKTLEMALADSLAVLVLFLESKSTLYTPNFTLEIERRYWGNSVSGLTSIGTAASSTNSRVSFEPLEVVHETPRGVANHRDGILVDRLQHFCEVTLVGREKIKSQPLSPVADWLTVLPTPSLCLKLNSTLTLVQKLFFFYSPLIGFLDHPLAFINTRWGSVWGEEQEREAEKIHSRRFLLLCVCD